MNFSSPFLEFKVFSLRLSNQFSQDKYFISCPFKQPGLLKKVQGMGWYLEESNLAQVSTNILDFELTPLHTVYEEICRDAVVSVRFLL